MGDWNDARTKLRAMIEVQDNVGNTLETWEGTTEDECPTILDDFEKNDNASILIVRIEKPMCP